MTENDFRNDSPQPDGAAGDTTETTTLLRETRAAADARASAVAVYPTVDISTLLDDWSGEPFDPDLARPELLHELFEQQADARPERIAVVCGSQQLTYAELECRANRLANLLRGLGAGHAPDVALLLPRGPDVYVAMLAVLKAGAAYVPIDPGYPPDRVAYILENCRVHTLLTTTELATVQAEFNGHILRLDERPPETLDTSSRRLSRDETGTDPQDVAYVIYTSGSTGRPKGVEIEHRSVTNLVRAEARIFGVHADDRVYQGFSVAFDASIEEIWLAFFAGATLVVGTSEMQHAGPALSRLLREAGVTVLSCVPTLLAMMEDDVPSLRLLILGGEQCPQNLVERWCRPGRRMVNTYGPTEATVIATYGDCAPGKPVTIGRPVPNYHAYILDDNLRPVAAGSSGELYLGGVGLARGYLGLPEATGAKFIANPFTSHGGYPSRLYKTGDLARFNPTGEIEFLGRADSQVKLRGFRIELAEIENVLLECPGVLAAVVTLRSDNRAIEQLVGYLVPETGATLNEDTIRAHLRTRLPVFMVPAVLETLDVLPTLASGKVDRTALPAPRSTAAARTRPRVAPRDELETKIAAVWESLFAPQIVSVEDDFFLDLGGHSLLAAQMVSELRRDSELEGLSMVDVYRFPTIELLAQKLVEARLQSTADKSKAEGDPESGEPAGFHEAAPWTHRLCGLAQTVGLYFILGFFSVQWLAPYLAYTWLVDNDYGIDEAILGALGSLLIVYPAMFLVAIAVKWTVIGRYRPGSYPLWGSYYFRWWFTQGVLTTVPTTYLVGTPLLAIFYRLLGARVGRNVHLGSDHFGCFDLLSIGDGTSIGTDAGGLGYSVSKGRLQIGAIEIGSGCRVGTRSVLQSQTVMDDGARLADLSLLTSGGRIPSGQTWIGSPARPQLVPAATAPAPEAYHPSRLRRIAFGCLYTLGIFIFPVLALASVFPGMMLMNHLNYLDDYYYYLVISPLVGLSFVVFLCLEIALVKWLLLGKVRAGTFRLDSLFYFRKWFIDQLLELSLDVLGPLYATIYLVPWYRMLGAKLGRRAEISTASFISPDLLTIDDEGFIADSVSLGAAHVENGHVRIAETRIGKRSFIGNSALLPPGSQVGDNCLIGCLSTTPNQSPGSEKDGTSWLGSPAIFLPQRQQSSAFSPETTFQPSAWLQTQRALIELARVILPSTFFIMLTSVLMSLVIIVREHVTEAELILLFPVLYAACGVVAALSVVAIKWVLMGRYRPCERPLWSTFVWRTELVTALHENLANLFVIDKLVGTPLVGWYFRMLGAKIGRRVFLETTDLTEFDLISIGDDVALNKDCTVQTHLFEDRVMKMSSIHIDDRCSVGCLSLVLYDTRMKAGSQLGDLSLLMKGETLPAETRWEGIPASSQSSKFELVVPGERVASIQ